MRKIAVITGSRAEFGVITPIIRAIRASPILDAKLIVTGQHLLRRYGYTIDDVRREFPVSATVPIFDQGESLAEQARAVGRGICTFVDVFLHLRPDIVFVTGDRGEQLAPAIAAVHLGIPVAHYVGGERSGGIDESIRHALTKFAHIHFVKSKESRDRVIRLGELPKHVFVVGFSGLDTMLSMPFDESHHIALNLNLDSTKPILVVLQHPVQASDASYAMEQTMQALRELKLQAVVLYPNSDAGSREIIDVIHHYKDEPWLRIVRSLPYHKYLSLLRVASVCVGNSSGFTAESLSFRLPVVLIGKRQQGRERTQNCIEVDHDARRIARAVRKALGDKRWRARIKTMKNPFGDGHTAEKIVRVLETIPMNNIIQKQITY